MSKSTYASNLADVNLVFKYAFCYAGNQTALERTQGAPDRFHSRAGNALVNINMQLPFIIFPSFYNPYFKLFA